MIVIKLLKILLALTVLLCYGCSEKPQNSEITVKEIKNQVSFERKPDTFKDLTLKSLLKQGDTVRTGSDSYAVLGLNASNVVRIASETTMVIDELDYQSADKKNAFSLATGAMLSEVNSAIGKGKYEVKTPNMAVGVRGTVFWSEVNASAESVIMLQGECHVAVKEGKEYTVKTASRLTLPKGKKEPVIEIIDEDKLPQMVKDYLKNNPKVKDQLSNNVAEAKKPMAFTNIKNLGTVKLYDIEPTSWSKEVHDQEGKVKFIVTNDHKLNLVDLSSGKTYPVASGGNTYTSIHKIKTADPEINLYGIYDENGLGSMGNSFFVLVGYYPPKDVYVKYIGKQNLSGFKSNGIRLEIKDNKFFVKGVTAPPGRPAIHQYYSVEYDKQGQWFNVKNVQ